MVYLFNWWRGDKPAAVEELDEVAVARYGLGGEFDGDDVDGGAEGALAALFEPEEQAKRVRVHTINVPTPEEFEAAAGGSDDDSECGCTCVRVRVRVCVYWCVRVDACVCVKDEHSTDECDTQPTSRRPRAPRWRWTTSFAAAASTSTTPTASSATRYTHACMHAHTRAHTLACTRT